MPSAGGHWRRPDRGLRSQPVDEVVIRRAIAADAAGIAALLGELGYPAPAAAIPARLERLAGETGQSVLVAQLDGHVVGLASVFTRHDITDDAAFARLAALIVRTDRQGEGIGRALVEAAEVLARAAGCRVIEVTSGDHRPGAHAFYRRLGFEERPRRFIKRL